MSQTVYRDNLSTAYPGLLDSYDGLYVESKVNGEASASIPFGVAVAKGSDDNKVIKLVDGNSVVMGVAVRHHTYDPGEDLDTSNDVKAGRHLSVLHFGLVWVTVEQAVVAGDPVFVRHTANGGNTVKGAFRKDSDSSNAKAIKGSYRSSAAQGGLALVFIGAGTL